MNSEKTYRAYLVSKDAAGDAHAAIVQRPWSELPRGDVVIRVSFSSVNFKDALSATGSPGVTRSYPHVPGIDAAGFVVSCTDETYRPGDPVLVTGYELGANHDGGYAELIRVPAEWVVPLPAGLSLKESMILGTAGLTAGLALQALRRSNVKPEQGEVVVTGASGGVGCLAVALLARDGYNVVASTGKARAHAFLRELGAVRIIDRAALDDRSGRPLLKGRWAGAVDTVGGNTLATLLAETQPHGSVAACGLVGGSDLSTTVFPFILRGVNLLGVDSAFCPRQERIAIWDLLATSWKIEGLEELAQTCGLNDLQQITSAILDCENLGRTLVIPTG